jgi:hypothetical protein
LPLETHIEIDVKQDQKLARDIELIKRMCWLKTLHDLKLFRQKRPWVDH